MLWLKRNILLVAVLLIAAGLTGWGGYYGYAKSVLNDDLTAKLGQEKAELTRLASEVKPSPTPENVRVARDDVKKSLAYSAQCRQLFVATPYKPLDSQSFRSMLETNIAELRRLAALSGVETTTNYNFSFEPQTKQMSFEPASLRPLSEQLTEISEVCRGLFNARIQRLEMIQRVAVSQYDFGVSSETLQGVNVSSNRYTGLASWPYQFSFECFSAELAAALEELSRIPRMLLIKTINIEASREVAPLPLLFGVPPPSGPGRAGAGPGVAPKPALTTVLEEKLLRVVIQIHVIKPAK